MRQAGNPSSVDKLRMQEMFRFQKNNYSKKPRPAHSREPLANIKTNLCTKSKNCSQ